MTVLHINDDMLLRCMHDFVLNKIVIDFLAKDPYLVSIIPTESSVINLVICYLLLNCYYKKTSVQIDTPFLT